MLYGTSNQVIYSDELTTLTLLVNMGVTQGEPLASLLFSTALRRAIDATLILHPTITIRGIADDRIFCGPLADVLAALATYAIELAKSRQTLQKSKTVIYAPAGESTIDTECVAHGYATASGLVIGPNPNPKAVGKPCCSGTRRLSGNVRIFDDI